MRFRLSSRKKSRGVDTPAISGSMPPQGELDGSLSDQEIADIIAHLRATFQ